MIYPIIRKLLFCLDPELAHHLLLNLLYVSEKSGITRCFPKVISNPRRMMGLSFINPVGLGAGLDKNGDYIDALATLGFGFIEVGSITPRPQPGNQAPRLFRLEAQQAIINRMGFNNKGVDYLVERLKRTRYQGILGINIGKNRDTTLEHAIDDYRLVLTKVLPYASYVTINLSSPNTEGLRSLQHGEYLRSLLRGLKQDRQAFYEKNDKYVPLVVKISPDLTVDEVNEMAAIFLEEKVDGVIATNTTVMRSGVEGSPYASEKGGLSGRPLFLPSTQILHQLHQQLTSNIPIIGCGGIMSATDAKEKMLAGASLVQIYTGLIYQGPSLVQAIARLS